MSFWTFFLGVSPPSSSSTKQPQFVPNEVVSPVENSASLLQRVAENNGVTQEQVEYAEMQAELAKLQVENAKRYKAAIKSIAKSEIAAKKALLEAASAADDSQIEQHKMVVRSQRVSSQKRSNAAKFNDLLAGVNSIGRGL